MPNTNENISSLYQPLTGVCPDQTCVLFDKRKEKEPDKSDRAVVREIAKELGIGYSTAAMWLYRSKKMSTIVDKKIEWPELPEGVFNLIYADPPWKYQHSVAGRREIEKEYDKSEPQTPTNRHSNLPETDATAR
ncbi:MAG: hypothetical protein ACYSR9_13545 [Planctomycetota bacterium]|jgi:16S rRNA G966 N2-methylase RsmD